jgi:hypothetical protein
VGDGRAQWRARGEPVDDGLDGGEIQGWCGVRVHGVLASDMCIIQPIAMFIYLKFLRLSK